MPYEFRTIEEFVLLLEGDAARRHKDAMAAQDRGNARFQMRMEGERDVFEYIASMVRNSNIGIVYPPGGSK